MKRAYEIGWDKRRCGNGNAIHVSSPGDFALRPIGIRPIERDYGSATSGESEAAPARGLFGSKEISRKNCPGPAGTAEGDEGKTEETGGRYSGRSLTLRKQVQFCKPGLRRESPE